MVERRHERQAAACGFCLRPRLAVEPGRSIDDHLGTVARDAVYLDARRGLRHHDNGADAEALRGEGDCLSVIARGVGDDTGSALLRREQREHVQGAPDLEGAHRLLVLAFEEKGMRRGPLRSANLDERSPDRNPADAVRGGDDVFQGDERGQLVPDCRGRANCSFGLYAGISRLLATRQPSSASSFMSSMAPV